MDDIHDIKNVLEIFQLNGYSLSYLLVATVMIIIVRIIKKKKRDRLKNINQLQYKEPIFDPSIYLKKLEELEKQIDELDTKKFYTRLKKIFLGYLEQVWYKQISKLSFEEIKRKKRPDDDIIALVKNIYYYWFDPKLEDITKIRKLTLKKIKNIISTK